MGIIEELLKNGALISSYDPEAMPNVKQRFGDDIEFSDSEYDALLDADALIICTEWGIFRNPDFQRMAKLMKDKVIFDGRNLFDVDEMTDKGFYYNSIGRRTIKA